MNKNIFADASTETGLKVERFIWDSSITGNIADPTGALQAVTLGTIGTTGKNCAKARCYVYSDSVNPNFGGGAPANKHFYIRAGNVSNILADYTPAGGGDDLVTDGWRLTQGIVAGMPAFPAAVAFVGGGVVELEIYNNNGTAYDLEGRMEVVIEYVEQD